MRYPAAKLAYMYEPHPPPPPQFFLRWGMVAQNGLRQHTVKADSPKLTSFFPFDEPIFSGHLYKAEADTKINRKYR